jgi:hypothetical protein
MTLDPLWSGLHGGNQIVDRSKSLGDSKFFGQSQTRIAKPQATTHYKAKLFFNYFPKVTCISAKCH